MIVLDTNVLSEVMRAKPDPAVLVWLDLSAASVYAVMLAERERIGRSLAMADAQIAAICLSREARLATRNTKHFEGLGLTLVNSWDSHASPTVS